MGLAQGVFAISDSLGEPHMSNPQPGLGWCAASKAEPGDAFFFFLLIASPCKPKAFDAISNR
jgi:hypothetical protein